MSDNLQWLDRRLGGEGPPVTIDGATGTELQRRGVALDQRVWSARAILTHPGTVRDTHAAYIEAGAEVVLTNSFAAGRHMLEPGGFGDQVELINRRAVELALEARATTATRPVAVAGSICEWVHAEDSRWSSPAALAESVSEQAGLLVEAGVDLLALEMCQRRELTLAALTALRDFDLPLWLGFSARRFAERQALSVFDYPERDFAELVEIAADAPAALCSIMHSPVNDVMPAVEILRRYWSGPVGVYPESGYFTMPDWHFVDIIEPVDFLEHARAWVASGVRAVGGCCGLGPEHIAVLSAGFAAATRS